MAAIVVVVGLALWLREREQGRSLLPQPVPVLETSSPVVVPQELLAEGSPARVESPASKQVAEEIERGIKRDSQRTNLIGLVTEAEQLVVIRDAQLASGQKTENSARLAEIQKAVQTIAEDRTFPDLQATAANSLEALKSGQGPRISGAVRAVTALPIQ